MLPNCFENPTTKLIEIFQMVGKMLYVTIAISLLTKQS